MLSDEQEAERPQTTYPDPQTPSHCLLMEVLVWMQKIWREIIFFSFSGMLPVAAEAMANLGFRVILQHWGSSHRGCRSARRTSAGQSHWAPAMAKAVMVAGRWDCFHHRVQACSACCMRRQLIWEKRCWGKEYDCIWRAGWPRRR